MNGVAAPDKVVTNIIAPKAVPQVAEPGAVARSQSRLPWLALRAAMNVRGPLPAVPPLTIGELAVLTATFAATAIVHARALDEARAIGDGRRGCAARDHFQVLCGDRRLGGPLRGRLCLCFYI